MMELVRENHNFNKSQVDGTKIKIHAVPSQRTEHIFVSTE